MKKGIYKKSGWSAVRSVIFPILFSAAVIGMVMFGLYSTEESSAAEGLRILEDSIRRAVVTSYAVDGMYPESVERIEEDFGIHIDRTKYVVQYDIFASNLMPNISVFAIGGTETGGGSPHDLIALGDA